MLVPHPIFKTRKIPSSRIFLWELPFWLTLLYGSLVPATWVTRQEWFGVPMKYSDLLILLSAGIYGAAAILQYLIYRRRNFSKGVLSSTLCLLAYGLVRVLTGALEGEDQLAMAFTLLLAAAAPVQAAGLLSIYDATQTRAFLNRLLLYLTIICLIYTAESVFSLGLRSEEGRNLGVDFGIQRVRGPLFGPSTGYLLLIPAIGWGLQSFFAGKHKRFLAFCATVTLLMALLGLGSRAALILLACYIISLALLMKQLKRKILTALLLAVLSIGAGVLIYGRADTQRLQSFEDSYRKTTHETAWNILANADIPSLLGGQGYGSIWAWYRRDILRGDLVAIGDNTILTGYGSSLYHCHSTFLELMVEFGCIGILWLFYVGGRIARLPFAPGADTAWRAFSWAIVISMGSLAFDLFVFKEVRVNAIWWIFLIAAFQLRPIEQRRATVQSVAGTASSDSDNESSLVGSMRVNRKALRSKNTENIFSGTS